jgi:hydrogenase-4 component B
MSTLLCSIVLLPMAAAILSYILGRFQKELRSYFADIITGVTFFLSLYLFIVVQQGSATGVIVEIPYICGMGLHFTVDGFRAMYAMIAAFMWFMSTLFSKEYFAHYRNRNRYYLFLLLTLGATEGVFLSADFYTTFIFFEIMSFTSYVWVAHDEKKESLRAAATYLAVAVIGGLVMLMGIFMLYDITGTLYFKDLVGLYANAGADSSRLIVAGVCMLFGFGAKAGAFPLHIWLPKAHPVAPAPASALLSGILTKAGMYGILIVTSYIFLGSAGWGSFILIIGVCTMVIGAVLALFSIDLKRTLACSSVSQIGFILVGVGMSGLLGEENTLAVRGSMLHMVNHSLIKLALFMAAGVIFMNVHKLDLNDIRGFGHKKPLLNYIFLMGALGIGGVPLWNGYISKTLIHESIVEYIELLRGGEVSGIFSAGLMKAIEWIFLISGGLTVAYMTKLYVCIFVEKNTDKDVQAKYNSLQGNYMNKVSAFALGLSATLLPIMGFFPGVVMDGLADMGQSFMQVSEAGEKISYFSLSNLKGAAISIIIGALIYVVIVRLLLMKKDAADTSVRVYVNRWHKYLDLENVVYRPLLLQILPFIFGVICRVLDSLVDTFVVILRKTIYKDSKLPQELSEGTAFSHACACIAEWWQTLGNLTFRKKNPRTVDYDHKFAIWHEEWAENNTVIVRSMSFGLLMFCIGLIITVAYLFLRDVFGVW